MRFHIEMVGLQIKILKTYRPKIKNQHILEILKIFLKIKLKAPFLKVHELGHISQLDFYNLSIQIL